MNKWDEKSWANQCWQISWSIIIFLLKLSEVWGPSSSSSTLSSTQRSYQAGSIPLRHPIKTSHEYIPLRHPIKTSHEYIPLRHPIKTSHEYIPLIHPIKTSHEYIPLIHPIKTSHEYIPWIYPMNISHEYPILQAKPWHGAIASRSKSVKICRARGTRQTAGR